MEHEEMRGQADDERAEHEDGKRLEPEDTASDACADGADQAGEAHNVEMGRRGEAAAARYLEMRGYEILDRNWSCPAGEVDIVAREEDTVVFCEVKTRTSLEKGLPSEAVDAEKRSRYEKIAAWYLRDYEFLDVPVRFDIVALLVAGEDRALVRHYCNAFAQGMF